MALSGRAVGTTFVSTKIRGGLTPADIMFLPFPAGVRVMWIHPAHPMAEKLAGRAVVRRQDSRNQRGIAPSTENSARSLG